MAFVVRSNVVFSVVFVPCRENCILPRQGEDECQLCSPPVIEHGGGANVEPAQAQSRSACFCYSSGSCDPSDQRRNVRARVRRPLELQGPSNLGLGHSAKCPLVVFRDVWKSTNCCREVRQEADLPLLFKPPPPPHVHWKWGQKINKTCNYKRLIDVLKQQNYKNPHPNGATGCSQIFTGH